MTSPNASEWPIPWLYLRSLAASPSALAATKKNPGRSRGKAPSGAREEKQIQTPTPEGVKMSRGTIKDQLQAAKFQVKVAASGSGTTLGKRVIPEIDSRHAPQQTPPQPPSNAPRPSVAKTPDQEITEARAQITAAESRVRAAAWALKDAQREVSLAEHNLHKLLVLHDRIAVKAPRAKNVKLTYDPSQGRSTPKIPSHKETGPLQGMTTKAPPVEKAVREAKEAIQQGYLHAKIPPRPPGNKPKKGRAIQGDPPKTTQRDPSMDSGHSVRVVDDRTLERENDATKDYWPIREGGRFGSHPSHDDHDN